VREESQEDSDKIKRKLKLVSIKGGGSKSASAPFNIEEDGKLKFESEASAKSKLSICGLCKAPILEEPEYYLDMPFHHNHVSIYMKLAGAFGQARVSDVGPSGVFDAAFFFVDVVGLSDPALSVRRQIEKIEALNEETPRLKATRLRAKRNQRAGSTGRVNLKRIRRFSLAIIVLIPALYFLPIPTIFYLVCGALDIGRQKNVTVDDVSVDPGGGFVIAALALPTPDAAV